MIRWIRAWTRSGAGREHRKMVARQLLVDAPELYAINPDAGLEAIRVASRIMGWR